MQETQIHELTQVLWGIKDAITYMNDYPNFKRGDLDQKLEFIGEWLRKFDPDF